MILLTIYLVLWAFIGFWAGYHANDTDEEGYFKFPWRLLIFTGMFVLIPAIAKIGNAI